MILLETSQYKFCLYFPVAQISSLSDAANYTTLPQRKNVYLGETLQFLLVLRFRGLTDRDDGALSRKDLGGSLCALASVCAAESWRQTPAEQCDRTSSCSEDSEDVESVRYRTVVTDCLTQSILFYLFKQKLSYVDLLQSAWVLEDQLIFCLTVSLDKLPVSTRKAKVGHTCMHVHVVCWVTFSSVMNCSSQDRMCVKDVKILPNYNSSYLPVMPDVHMHSVHQSAEITMASFCRLDNKSSHLPCMLSALEEQTFIFQLQLQEKEEQQSSKGLEVPLLAVLQWHSPVHPAMRCISTCYSIPSVHLNRPELVMMASCPRTIRPQQHFLVKYTLLNNLQDFLAVRLIWNSEGEYQILQTVSSVWEIIISTEMSFLQRVAALSLRDGEKFSHSRSAQSRAITTTSPAGTVNRAPHLPPDPSFVSLVKIAKRECKVLVLE
uniref:Microtubule associated protein 1 n=1 Tax=Pundamilia nyererei TaxID=303518 RepID=A0A3B4FQ30_9CICH